MNEYVWARDNKGVAGVIPSKNFIDLGAAKRISEIILKLGY